VIINGPRDERIHAWLLTQFHPSILATAEAAVVARGKLAYLSHICKELDVKPPDEIFNSTAEELAAEAKAKANKSEAVKAAGLAELKRLRDEFKARNGRKPPA